MATFLPFAFIALATIALVAAISFMWASLRSILAGEHGVYVRQSEAMQARAELLIEKDAILRSLKDLEFERAVGKLSDEDFARLDAQFREKAKVILRQLDADSKEHREKAEQAVQAEIARVTPQEKK